MQLHARLSSANSLQLIQVFPLMNTADSILVICRSLIQAHSNGSCLWITFPPIQNSIRLERRLIVAINKCHQNIAAHKAKAMQSRVC